jgi:hypothetical protein
VDGVTGVGPGSKPLACYGAIGSQGGLANGSRECAPGDKLRVIRQETLAQYASLLRQCF